MEETTKVLNQKQISQKIKRLAIEILEHNYKEKKIILAGINNNGLQFAKLLLKEMKAITDIEIVLSNISLNPAKPTSEEVSINMDEADFKNKVVIIVDDVANTGRTIFFAFKPFLDILTKKVEVAVLIDRMHKSFPIKVDYKGLTLATTLQENIVVTLKPLSKMEVYLH